MDQSPPLPSWRAAGRPLIFAGLVGSSMMLARVVITVPAVRTTGTAVLLMGCLLAGGVWWWWHRHRLPVGAGVLGITLMVLCGFAGDVAVRLSAHQQSEDLRSALRSAQPGPQDGSDHSLDRHRRLAGEFATIERFLTSEFLGRMAAANQAYQASLESIGYSSILDAPRIAADLDGSQTKMMTTQAQRAVAVALDAMQAAVTAARTEIDRLDLADDTRRDLRAAFDRGMGKDVNMPRLWELEAETIRRFDAAVRILQAHRDQWSVVNQQFRFTDPEVERACMSQIDAGLAMAAEQDALRDRLRVSTLQRP